jgi:hypothetical protein
MELVRLEVGKNLKIINNAYKIKECIKTFVV